MYLPLVLLVIIMAQLTYLIYRSEAKSPQRKPSKRPVYVDTSALMDGRIVTAAQTGFIPYDIVVPKSVVAELQYLADQADNEKRSRARRGIDAISELQEMSNINVTIFDDGPTDNGGVDERLVSLAKKNGGSICTIDFNLNKVASVQGITILNINELAGNIRMAFLPGETISLGLTQKGQGNNQAVGYLADGTMVVVDKAASHIGQTVEIEFIRSLQTAAGRMMFAKLLAKTKTPQSHPQVDSSEHTEESSEPKTKQRRGDGRAKGRTVTQQTNGTPSKISERNSERKSQNASNMNAHTESEVAQPTATQVQKNVRPKQNPRQPRKRQTKEDSLIELVNNQ